MEHIKISDLQNLASFIHEESNLSLRNKLSAWVQAKSSNNDHADLSQLASIASQSSIKDKIMDWINSFTSNTSIVEEPVIVLPEEVVFENPIVINEDLPQIEPAIEIPVKKVRKKKD